MKKVLLLSTLSCLLFTATAHAQSVDLLWEGEGYTPPFYQGGTPWASEGKIRFVAVPQGLGNAATFTYKWTRNGTVLGNLNGVGQRTLEIQDTIFSKPMNVMVEIVSDDLTLAQDSVTVASRAPGLLIYEKNPLYGYLFNKEASAGYTLTENEVSLTAFPLFYSLPSRSAPSLTYSWRSKAGVDSTSDSVTYRAPTGAAGTASVSVHVTNTETLKQTTEKRFLIQFNNASN